MVDILPMRIEKLDNWPTDANPFVHDLYNMGTRIASNAWILHPSHPNQWAAYILVFNPETGERLKIWLGDTGK